MTRVESNSSLEERKKTDEKEHKVKISSLDKPVFKGQVKEIEPEGRKKNNN